MSEEIKDGEINPEINEETPKKQKKKLTKLEKWFRTMHRFHGIVMRPFLPYKKVGHTDFFDDRAYVIVGNHLSVLDVIPAAIATSRPVHFMAKKELFEKGIGKWFTKKCECIPVSRDGSDVRAMMTAMKCLKNGESVCIFPEGTRNKSDEIFLPFKSGATAIAIRTKTPIIPLIQVRKIKLFKRSYYYYGKPIEFTEFYDRKLTEKDIEEADEKLKQILLKMYYDLEDWLDSKKKSNIQL